MRETIGIRLTELASQYVDIYLAEAEDDRLPYAVYSSDVTPVYTKDGVHHYEASVTITVYHMDLDKCDGIADSIIEAVQQHMRGGTYGSLLLADHRDCSEGVWTRELSYTIKQYS